MLLYPQFTHFHEALFYYKDGSGRNLFAHPAMANFKMSIKVLTDILLKKSASSDRAYGENDSSPCACSICIVLVVIESAEERKRHRNRENACKYRLEKKKRAQEEQARESVSFLLPGPGSSRAPPSGAINKSAVNINSLSSEDKVRNVTVKYLSIKSGDQYLEFRIWKLPGSSDQYQVGGPNKLLSGARSGPRAVSFLPLVYWIVLSRDVFPILAEVLYSRYSVADKCSPHIRWLANPFRHRRQVLCFNSLSVYLATMCLDKLCLTSVVNGLHHRAYAADVFYLQDAG
ncbi:hypothetical protein GQR58_008847 [Nymphon striatum]|nr:hypothetical protein GQR58_008847 [Nymphon striatum]